ncbi:hypothetical protein CGZ98_06155 [Enemella evansiae]|uniref:hypothetical protein n=1 Tax=Enemella evansiae TaxID=2016499 RepID=UPI000B95FA4D|nr:hypothetical protein [Enemella evansiae]OYO13125.1 hypothetical protein CGZ98_06155 [Enemella evansiae]
MSDDEMERELAQMMRMMLTTGGQFTEIAARNRERRARTKMEELQARTAADERAGRARAQEWKDAQRRTWEQASWGDWRDNATLADWATAYTAARGARDEGLDPQAAKAADMIREETRRRFGVDLAQEYARLHDGAEPVGEPAREHAASHERDADQHFAAEDEQARDRGPEPTVLTEEEFARRYSDRYKHTSGDWVAGASPDEFVEAYAAAREAEAHDPLARLAATNMEDRYAAQHPDRFPEGGQQFRWTWDRVQENIDRGAHTGQRGPNQDPARLEHAEGMKALGDARADRIRAAQTDTGQGRGTEVSLYRDPAQATTLDVQPTAREQGRAEEIVHSARPGFATLDKAGDSKRIRSSKAKSRPLAQGRDQKRTQRKGM